MLTNWTWCLIFFFFFFAPISLLLNLLCMCKNATEHWCHLLKGIIAAVVCCCKALWISSVSVLTVLCKETFCPVHPMSTCRHRTFSYVLMCLMSFDSVAEGVWYVCLDLWHSLQRKRPQRAENWRNRITVPVRHVYIETWAFLLYKLFTVISKSLFFVILGRFCLYFCL